MALKTAKDIIIGGQVPPRMKDRYTLRGKSAKFGFSNNSNPMITWECEFVDPTTITVDGVTYDLTSLKPTYWIVLNERGLAEVVKVGGFMEKLGLQPQIDDENPDVQQFVGLVFDAIIDSAERIAEKPDPENPGKMTPILDANGEKVSEGWQLRCDIRQILGLSSFTPTNPY